MNELHHKPLTVLGKISDHFFFSKPSCMMQRGPTLAVCNCELGPLLVVLLYLDQKTIAWNYRITEMRSYLRSHSRCELLRGTMTKANKHHATVEYISWHTEWQYDVVSQKQLTLSTFPLFTASRSNFCISLGSCTSKSELSLELWQNNMEITILEPVTYTRLTFLHLFQCWLRECLYKTLNNGAKP